MHNALNHEGLHPVIMFYDSKSAYQEVLFLTLAG